MLEEIRVRDYKSFAGPVTIPLKPITVLLGKNNSGKTAIARLPISLSSALAKRTFGSSALRAGELGLGTTFRDIVHRKSAHAVLGLGLTLVDDEARRSVDVEIQLLQSLAEEKAILSSFMSKNPDFEGRWQGGPGGRELEQGPHLDGLFPAPIEGESKSQLEVLRDAIAKFAHRSRHLHSVRAPLMAAYEVRDPGSTGDTGGSDAAHELYHSESLQEAVADWYQANLGARLEVVSEAATFYLSLRNKDRTNVNLARAGQGLRQLLPVVVALQDAVTNPSPNRLIVVEEPELHLHPAAHGGVADLFVQAAESGRSQVLVETHSENFVLRLRRRAATGELKPEDVSFLWFEENDGVSTIHEITVDSNGRLSDWPDGVFSEDLEEVRAIAQART
ncbi:DUF3696 domain-containing protein [Agromyces badenianii]|uniref:DUF3696 domain-containing protein n=1 Tax=Agromyces badenianii TaxID=2080742 RepID=UPI000D596690|nr:DUF3696 domain-containing protein [Agromyces badenianii]PWC02899.1 hypothetical protein DCE94_14045 [Agromyces badenianii]